MEEGNAMSTRILRIIENIIKSNPNLQEFTVIPTAGNIKNKTPVLYEQNTIGLESWCVKHVYQHASTILFNQREKLSRKRLSFSKMQDLNHLLIGAILINTDVGTFWNMKRELVEMDVLTLEDELQFSKIVLTHKSKSNEAFSYRRWLLKRNLDKMVANNLSIPVNLLQHELLVTHMASEKSVNNYHSWNHRIWCMENIAAHNQNISNIVYSELSYSQEWINSHISEHVGYHYRQYLIELVKRHKRIVSLFDCYYNFVVTSLLNLINDGECDQVLTYLLGKRNEPRLLEESYFYVNYICILLYDLYVLIDKLNELFPEHEALYYHRKFIVYSLLKVPFEYHNLEFKTDCKIIENDINVINKNITDSDSITNVQSPNSYAKDNIWPKSLNLSMKQKNSNLHEIVLNCEKSFALHNDSVFQLAKYSKWLTRVIGLE